MNPSKPHPPGLIFTGVDTGVGKTYVACLAARALAASGVRVGVYKPAASGCREATPDETAAGLTDESADATRPRTPLLSDDALSLWNAAGRPGRFVDVCPQAFAAPLAPHLAAAAEGRRLDERLLRTGLAPWRRDCQVVVVEGAGGLLSPLGLETCTADLAADFGYPLVIVARNMLGVLHQVRQTLFTAQHWRGGLTAAGVVLTGLPTPDPSAATNRQELERLGAPILGEVLWRSEQLDRPLDWLALASATGKGRASDLWRADKDAAPLPVRQLP